MFRYLVVILGVFVSLSGLSSGAYPDKPMTFAYHQACEGNSSLCAPYILAQGIIVSSTPKDFVRFLGSDDFKARIFFDSPGGDLIAGLQLGRLIRSHKLDTYIGGPYERLVRANQPYEVIVPEPICFSACAYAFLGGVRRKIEEGGKFGVHQFRGSTQDWGGASAQVTTALLSAYLDEMSVDRKFLDLASLTQAKQIRLLTPQEARSLNVDNTAPPLSAWRLVADAHGLLALITVQRQESQEGAVVLMVYKGGDSLVATLWYRPIPQGRSIEQIKEIFSGRAQFDLRVGQHTFCLQSKSAWAASRGGFQISFGLPPSAIHSISQARSFDFVANWPNAYRDLDPSATFGTEGFGNGTAALMRQD
jgi:hypothetical protein